MRKLYTVILLGCLYIGYSQTPDEINKIVSNIDIDQLEQAALEGTRLEQEREARVNVFLNLNPTFEKIIYRGDAVIRMYDVVDGNPLYQTTDNVEAAIGTRTNFLQVGGDLGLDLEGEDMRISIWEVGGITRASHVEFNMGGSASIDPVEAGTITFHSTHVSGTIVAGGLNNNAKGMAPKAILGSYTTNNVFSPLTTEIINDGLLISNHSYGVPVIGENGTLPAWRMGAYNNDARTWDNLLHNAPTHLAVFSAGNSGNDDYDDGLAPGFDKLTGEKNAKNTLVVANASGVNLNANGEVLFGLVNMNSSSSRGPTDDGRVKPDITGMGTDILSTASNSDTSYGSATGTSMSAPNVSGSILLLQELYNDTNGNFMLAATAKALVCGTASDGGVEGPDATYGWGLMNSKKAAEAILGVQNEESVILEKTLNNGDSYQFDVTASGSDDLIVTIAWNDPAGTTVNNVLNDPTPQLVNDLDIRISDASETYFPWKLNYSNLSGAATKEDNNLDNVEQVYIENPVANATYTIIINHKGSLDGGSQDYSIVGTGFETVTLSNAEFEASTYSMWPNPVNNVINFSFNEALEGNSTVQVYDLSGRRVAEQNFVNAGKNLSLDVNHLIKGVYIVKLQSNQGFLTKKLIKK